MYKGKIGRLAVKEGKSVEEIVDEFNKIYHLNNETLLKLKERMNKILELYKN